VTGPLSSREVAIRSLNAFQLFVPRDYDEGAISSVGLSLVTSEDRTESVAKYAARRLTAREARRDALVKIEGEESIDRGNEVFRVAAALASERQLSVFCFMPASKSNSSLIGMSEISPVEQLRPPMNSQRRLRPTNS
jgi:hypothetical protein